MSQKRRTQIELNHQSPYLIVKKGGEYLRLRLDGALQKLSGKFELAGAMRYALSRWVALNSYIKNGHAEIDNNVT